jgi:hypothetical protein
LELTQSRIVPSAPALSREEHQTEPLLMNDEQLAYEVVRLQLA